MKDFVLIFKALSDENRLKILSLLSDEEICACKILEKLNITQPTLSHHMKILCKYGLVLSNKKGIWMHYSLNKEKLNEATKFINDIFNNKIAFLDKECE